MRKLATAALAFSAAIFLANNLLPAKWIFPAVIAAALSGVLLTLPRRRWLRPAVLALLFFAAGLLEYGIYVRATVDRAARYAGQTCTVRGTVLDYPDDYGSYCRLRIRLGTDGLPAFKAIVYDNHRAFAAAEPGQELAFTAKLRTADTLYGEAYDGYHADGFFLRLSVTGDEQLGERRFSVAGLPKRLHRFLCARVDRLFPDDCRAFVKALMLGEKENFYEDDALYVSMSRAGLMHVVAVSGMHIAFLVAFLGILLGNGRRGAIVSILLIWCFVLVAGAPGSAVRAAFMQTLLLLAPILRRENDPLTALSAVLMLLLAACPLAAGSVSLQMSFAAMAGILCFFERIYGWLTRRLSDAWLRPPLSYFPGVIASSLSVMVFTTPLTALHFSSVPLLAVFGNLACLWAVSLCFCTAWAACLLSFVPLTGKALAWLCAWGVRYILFCAAKVSALPGAVLYMQTAGAKLWVLASYALLLVGLLLRRRRFLRVLLPAGVSLALLAAIAWRTERYYRGQDFFTVLNVGQGQCITAFAGETTAVVDCGNTSSRQNAGAVAGEYLLSCGRKRVDLLLLSHLHADHANGAVRLMEMLPVDTLVLPAEEENTNGLYGEILSCARRRGTEIRFLSQDADLSCGRLRMRVYAPTDSGEKNERCLIARLSVGETDLLTTADATGKRERDLAAQEDLSGTEILVVGHHGSKNASTSELLRSIGGRLAVISVGYNRYGHPTQQTLKRLADCGYTVLRTDRDGTIEMLLEKNDG